MKTKKIVIYIILISTILSLILAGCASQNKLTNSIIIQSTEVGLSSKELSEAAKIIRLRLESYNTGSFDLKENPLKSQIEVYYSDEWKRNELTPLLTLKGELKFFSKTDQSNGNFPDPVLTDNDIESTEWKSQDENSMNYCIGISLTENASRKWAVMTQANIGKPVSILLDDSVLASPVIRAAISNGKCEISGNYTEQEAKTMAILMSNKLPCSFHIVK